LQWLNGSAHRRKPILLLRSVTCHMVLHSVTFLQTEIKAFHYNSRQTSQY